MESGPMCSSEDMEDLGIRTHCGFLTSVFPSLLSFPVSWALLFGLVSGFYTGFLCIVWLSWNSL